MTTIESSSLCCVSIPAVMGNVGDGIYRSGFPSPEEYLCVAALQIKVVINLLDQLPDSYKRYLHMHGIRLIHMPVQGNKTSSDELDADAMTMILRLCMDQRCHPILIHCRSGKHRTGVIMACLRKIQGWTSEDAIREYRLFAAGKERDVDEECIRQFQPMVAVPPSARPPPEHAAKWLPAATPAGTHSRPLPEL